MFKAQERIYNLEKGASISGTSSCNTAWEGLVPWPGVWFHSAVPTPLLLWHGWMSSGDTQILWSPEPQISGLPGKLDQNIDPRPPHKPPTEDLQDLGQEIYFWWWTAAGCLTPGVLRPASGSTSLANSSWPVDREAQEHRVSGVKTSWGQMYF